MHTMHVLAGLDLNLLFALDAMLRTGSVSTAAVEIGRSQSAVSHALNRLRHHFGDPLLVRDGWEMRLTPRAQELRQPVRVAVDRVADVFRRPSSFDPATSTRRIRVATRDICAPLLSPFVAHIARAAPCTRVEITSPGDIRAAVRDGAADLGLRFGVIKRDASLKERTAYHLTWAVFCAPGHPYARNPTQSEWRKAKHATVGSTGARQGPIEKIAKSRRINRRILVSAPNFMSALGLARDCDAVFTTLRQPFEALAESIGLVAQPPPFKIAAAPAVVTQPADFGDPFRTWLAEIAAQRLPALDGPEPQDA